MSIRPAHVRARRTACAAAVGAVALALLPATAVPAHAAATTVPVADALASLRHAAVSTRETVATFGARVDLTATYTGPGLGGTDRGVLRVDTRQRAVRADIRFAEPLLGSPVFGSLDGHPCHVNGFTFDPAGTVTLHRAGVGTYEWLGAPRTRVVRQARRLTGLRDAKWELRVRRGLTFEQAIAREDPATSLIGALDGLTAGEVTSATSEPVTLAGSLAGTRWTLTGPSGGAVVDVHAGGPVASLSMTGRETFGGVTTTSSTKVTYSYVAQTVAIPALGDIVRPSRLRRGCVAAVTRDAVRGTASDVAEAFADRPGRAKVRKVRRAVRAALRSTHGTARVRTVAVDGGVRVVGRHRLLPTKRVVRDVVVVDGRVVVRKRRG